MEVNKDGNMQRDIKEGIMGMERTRDEGSGVEREE